MVMFDVVEAILLRLPVKDLLRCKSVCESWYSLISSPSFIQTNVKFICNKEEGRRIVMKSYEPSSVCRYHAPPDILWYEHYGIWSIEGSSNGLVLYSGGKFRIWVTNPVTREFRELQEAPEKTAKEVRCFGFGYDSSTDDYKVVMAICKQGKTLVRILSLKSNIWKLFGHVNYEIDDHWRLKKRGILFNGALHWFWFDANDEALIVSFDLAKEEFREIPQPDDTRYVWNMNCSLGIMEGRLCIYPSFDDDEDFPSFGTWVLKNYNVKPSWELLPKDCEMKNHAIHYIINYPSWMPTYSCNENIQRSRSKEYISSPIFVQTLVSPYVNNNGRPSHKKNKKGTANAGSVKRKSKRKRLL